MTGHETGGGTRLPSAPSAAGGQYVDARAASDELRRALQVAGLTDALPELRSDLEATGSAVLSLGRADPAAVTRIAELIEVGHGAGLRSSTSDNEREEGQS
jgi:hypothetical protein